MKKGQSKLSLPPNLLLNWVSCHNKTVDCKKKKHKKPKKKMEDKYMTKNHDSWKSICENRPWKGLVQKSVTITNFEIRLIQTFFKFWKPQQFSKWEFLKKRIEVILKIWPKNWNLWFSQKSENRPTLIVTKIVVLRRLHVLSVSTCSTHVHWENCKGCTRMTPI